MTRAAAEDAPMIDAFCDALWLEDGLSVNTLAAYRRDLTQFAVWLRRERGHGPLAATHADLLGFLAARYAARTKASSASRSARCGSTARSIRSPRVASPST